MTWLLVGLLLGSYGWLHFVYDRLSRSTYHTLRRYRVVNAIYLLLILFLLHKATLWHQELQFLIRQCS